MAPTAGGMLNPAAGSRIAALPGASHLRHGLVQPRSPGSPSAPGMGKGMSATMPRHIQQGEFRAGSIKGAMSTNTSQAGGTSSSLRGCGSDVGSNAGGPVRQPSMGNANMNVNSSPSPGIASHGSHKPLAPSAGGATPRPTSALSMPGVPPTSASPPRPLSAQSSQSHAQSSHSHAQSSQSQAAAPRPLSVQSSQTQVRPDLRRWTDEDLRRQIQLLEKGLKGAPTAGAVGSNGSPLPVQSSGAQSPRASVSALQSLAKANVGVDASESFSPLPQDFLEQEVKRLPGGEPVPEKVELSLKERQVVELRAQIARREINISSRGRVVDGIEVEHLDPERTGPPALASSAAAPLANAAAGGTGSVASGQGSGFSLERLVAERASSNAGANTPGTHTQASTPGGRETSQLEGELAWVVRQMEGHRRQISDHQQKLSALEKRHAEIISSLSAHGIGASRSPASTAAERLDMLDDSNSANGFDASTTRLGFHKDLLEAASGDNVLRREIDALGPDDILNASVASSTLSASVARATERAERALRSYSNGVNGRGSSRPTSAGSATTAASAEVGSTTRSVRSQGNPFAPKVGRDALGRGPQISSGSGSATGSRQPAEGNEVTGGARGSAALASEGAGFGKSHEAERIVYLLSQFGMKRSLRVPFVPLDAAVEGEGRPYLHGALEVRLCLSGDGDRLMVRVGSGATGTGGRLFEIQEFVNRAEAIEARRSQRPTPIAEEVALQAELPLADRPADSIGGPFPNVDNANHSSLASMLGRSKQDYVDIGSSALPWKKLFKSHWSGTG